jgi:hypothetical protein
MKTENNNKLQPQTKENITKAEWFKKEALSELMQNTYPSINDLVLNHFKIIL